MGLAPATGTAVRRGLWQRLKAVALTDVGVLLRGLDRDALARVERVLLEADFGSEAFGLVERLEEVMRGGEIKTEGALRAWLVEAIATQVRDAGSADALHVDVDGSGPAVILVLGVNGVGKTTQTAKLAHRLKGAGRRVLLAAADTYRAGAVEQLAIWADRLGVPCVTGQQGGDPAAVAFDAIEAATARGADVVLVDTAGRLHTQGDLMDELRKVVRVVSKKRPGAPHEALLVLDGTVGQNALQQGRAFADAVPLTGVIVTKLDGTAKGGVVLGIAQEVRIPVRWVGLGERIEDLDEFSPETFARALFASDEPA